MPGSSSSVLDEEVLIFYDCLQEMNLSSECGALTVSGDLGKMGFFSFLQQRKAGTETRVAKDPKHRGSRPALTSTEERTLFQPHLPIPIHSSGQIKAEM